MTVNQVVFFEIRVDADGLPAAAAFYSQVFGWEIEPDETQPAVWNITGADGSSLAPAGALTARLDEWDSTVNTIEVASLEAIAADIARAGGRALAPPVSVPGGDVQYCEDLEGNIFAIFQRAPGKPDGD